MSGTYNTLIMARARAHLGVQEWPGATDNPQVMEFFKEAGASWVQHDETPWCAAFVGAVLAESGLQGTGRLNARSYTEWGVPVTMRDAQPGDVVVLWRKHPDAAEGHVAFFASMSGDRVTLLGGNQGDKVSLAEFPTSRIIAIRRGVPGDTQGNRPVLRQGMRGAMVLDLQDSLSRLNYFSGKLDGVFGPLTDTAVRSFQRDNGLTVDGIVGRRTWGMLDRAHPKPSRDVTKADLVNSGSRTMKQAKTVKTAVTTSGVLAAGGTTLQSITSAAQSAQNGAQQARGALDSLSSLVATYWPLLLIFGAGLVIWLAMKRIEAARLDDARTGANLKR